VKQYIDQPWRVEMPTQTKVDLLLKISQCLATHKAKLLQLPQMHFQLKMLHQLLLTQLRLRLQKLLELKKLRLIERKRKNKRLHHLPKRRILRDILIQLSCHIQFFQTLFTMINCKRLTQLLDQKSLMNT
jgi:hypothetical protein